MYVIVRVPPRDVPFPGRVLTIPEDRVIVDRADAIAAAEDHVAKTGADHAVYPLQVPPVWHSDPEAEQDRPGEVYLNGRGWSSIEVMPGL